MPGMLVGHGDEVAFGGQAPAYLAHFARPFLENALQGSSKSRTRSGSTGSELYKEKTFSVGDILKPSDNGPERAAVVRVVYKPKTPGKKNDQVRKLLLLIEVTRDGDMQEYSLRPGMFPASWPNWNRIPLSKNGSWGANGAERDSNDAKQLHLTFAKMKEVDQVSCCHRIWLLCFLCCMAHPTHTYFAGVCRLAQEATWHVHIFNGGTDCWSKRKYACIQVVMVLVRSTLREAALHMKLPPPHKAPRHAPPHAATPLDTIYGTRHMHSPG